MPTLTEMLDLAYQQAHRVLLDLKQTELTPIFLLEMPEGLAVVAATPWFNDEQKEMVAQAMREMMREKGVIRYSFLCEAWTAHVPVNAWKEGISTMPRDRPDRIEVVIASAHDKDTTMMRMWRIIRNAKGKITALEPEGKDELVSTNQGRFANLLQPDVPPRRYGKDLSEDK